MQNDPWIFNYRSHCHDDSDSDSDRSSHGYKSKISEESRLRSELDISTRPDAAVFRPNPFSIAKMNAFTRSSRCVVAEPDRAAEKPKNAGAIGAFFGKTFRKKPVTCKEPSTIGGHLSPSPRAMSTKSRNVEKQPSKPPRPRMALHPHSPDRPKSNVIETISNRPPQVNTDFARHNPGPQPVPSSRGVAHTPIRVGAQEEFPPILSPLSKKISDSIYAETVHVPSPGTCSGRRAVMHAIHPGKENQSVVPREDPCSLLSARGKQESPQPIISSTNDEKTGSVPFKPKYVSRVIAIPPEKIARSGRAPRKQPFNRSSKVDSMAHISASTVKYSPKCYEAKPDEDESWSTLPPRKKFKPSVQPMSKHKTTGPFCIPGLRHDSNAAKTGRSATSSTRVITFLPTPLLSGSHEGQSKPEFGSLSSPQSSPQSQHCSSFAEESGGTRVLSSSPPTSDLPDADCDLEIDWDMHHLEERYALVPKAIEEHRRNKQLIWNLLELDSNCYVYRDDEDVETDVRIVLWRGLG